VDRGTQGGRQAQGQHSVPVPGLGMCSLDAGRDRAQDQGTGERKGNRTGDRPARRSPGLFGRFPVPFLLHFSPPPLSTSTTSSARAPPLSFYSIGRRPDPSELLLPASYARLGFGDFVQFRLSLPQTHIRWTGGFLTFWRAKSHTYRRTASDTRAAQPCWAEVVEYAVQGVLGLMGLVWS
jgi:hypothetical protein